jgi:endo-1,4-beta-xylanase
MIMPMNELKFSLIQPEPGAWNFEPADRIVDFALQNDRLTRGTCHVWWGATPEWVERLETAGEAEAALVDHIEQIGDRYKGRLTGWDVVNEVVANNPHSEGPLRQTTWLEKLGPNHIPIAFAAAARADPAARLVINDYDLEFVGPRFDLRREIVLGIVRQLQDGNIPVHGVGIQGHLYAGRQIDKDGLERFHRELDRMGVGLMVTELDVIDWETAPGNAAQDETAYGLVADLLDGVFAWKAPDAVIVWGISDRYSWISEVLPRPDGHPDRPLPLDRDMRPKPWMSLLKTRLQNA